MAEGFISQEKFTSSSSRVERWADLPLKTTYRINEIKEKTVDRNGEKVKAKYALLTDENGEAINVWLTSILEDEMKNYDVNAKKVYIQSYGLKQSKINTTRSYYDFEIVVDDEK